MYRWETVGLIGTASYSGSGDDEGPDFIRCMDGRDPQVNEVWTLGKDGVTCEVHLTAQVDIGAGFFREFATD